MTLGEKIKEVRKQAELSQEQLAGKMGVSRSAIAKWETDKGLPDVENLQVLARLMNVRIDDLLSSDGIPDGLTMREAYDLGAYGKGSRKAKKDRVIRERFPDARIFTLLAKVKLTTSEKVIDNLLGFLTDAPFGIPELINDMKHLDEQFYLVEQDGRQFLVTVTDAFVETRRLAQWVAGDRFEIGDRTFIKCTYEVK